MGITPHMDERRFVVDKVAWCVYEHAGPWPCGQSLVFETESVARRVRDYPPHWRELSSAALYELSWGR
ncbi:MAG TPA: hypothetical protein VGH98_08600 [Gemmatimonadaceae bacterium]|jgi:hypothetical protein